MQRFLLPIALLPLGLVPLALLPGCPADDGDTGDTADSGDTADTGDTGDTGADSGAAVTVTGTMTIWPGSSPLNHASVCWTPGGPTTYCDDTGAMGLYSIDVPAGSDGYLLVESTAVVRSAMPLVWGEDGDAGVDYALETQAVHDSYYAQVQVDDSPALGTLAVQVVNPDGHGLADVEIRLDPEGSWEGPFYVGVSGTLFEPKAVATLDGIGLAYFLAVDPAAGPYTPVITADGLQCDGPRHGVALPDGIPALAGTTTNLVIECD